MMEFSILAQWSETVKKHRCKKLSNQYKTANVPIVDCNDRNISLALSSVNSFTYFWFYTIRSSIGFVFCECFISSDQTKELN